MRRCLATCFFFSLAIIALLSARPLAADSPPGGDDWKYDVVYRKNGDSFRGVVLQHECGEVRMWCMESILPASADVRRSLTYLNRSPRDQLRLILIAGRAV